ncbi:VIR protein [Plasmodium vivax]|uniref:VIR protein n=1 Tax=Plasmodium vivax TaxID=5855 RepID=A0A1G4E3W5_PLAVI|nr:VIR protein [Plasmodium vivax]SCA60428.1 VIR protein [Plasmodium vivax]
MYSGDLNIKRIPFKVFYDGNLVGKNNILPSEKRNIDIIRSINFGDFLQYIKDKKEENINSWLYNHKTKLEAYLKRKTNNLDQKELDKHCKHLNYILDFVVQAVNNLDYFKFFQPRHQFEINCRDLLQSYTSLNCTRNFDNSPDKNLYIKKIMYDLFDDIEYMLSHQNNRNRTQCLNMFNRIKYRLGILRKIYVAVRDKRIFNLDDSCTFSIINKKFQTLKCNSVSKPPKSVLRTDSPQKTLTPTDSPLQTLPRTDSQPPNPVQSQDSGLLESRVTEEAEDPIDAENLEISLSINEDPPKLDTTYAAASLAGISLFGTILYKYGPFRNRFNSRRGAINGSNIFPIDNHVYDANTMNNFEYLQTGITNDEYQVGYGSVTDY